MSTVGCQSAHVYCIRSCSRANMSRQHRRIVVQIWILLFALSITQCKPEDYIFPSYPLYEHGSQFENNLNKVWDDLVSKTSKTGFNVSSYGEYPNRIYGLLQCRGDASRAGCDACCQNMKQSRLLYCGNGTKCYAFSDMCELFYDNYTSPMLYGYGFLGSCDGFSRPDPNGLQNLLLKLTAEASTSSKRFAAESSVDSSGTRMYGLVQCYRDLSIANCSYCLSQALQQISLLNLGLGSHVYMESCFVLISTHSDYSCAGSSTSTTSQVNDCRRLPINLGVVRGVALLMALLLLSKLP